MFYKYVECYYLENVLLFFDYFLIYCRNIYIINFFVFLAKLSESLWFT